MEMRVLKLLSVVAVVLVGAIAVLFVFGTPQSTVVAQVQSVSASQEPGAAAPGSSGEAVIAREPVSGGSASSGDLSGMGAADPDAQAPEADPASPLAIEIPGCVCHSDDPEEVERHSTFRMNQCAGCHLGGPE